MQSKTANGFMALLPDFRVDFVEKVLELLVGDAGCLLIWSGLCWIPNS
jgi:hypothetical protein